MPDAVIARSEATKQLDAGSFGHLHCIRLLQLQTDTLRTYGALEKT
jgi:hypothetical protein